MIKKIRVGIFGLRTLKNGYGEIKFVEYQNLWYLKIYKWSFPLNGIRSAPNYDLEHTFPYFIDGLRFSEEPPYSNMEIEDAFAKELEMAANNYFVENRINFFKF